ncbi:MAG: hypothetical protein PHT88_00725 [Candidatus Moranbacteria bacterium]|nr:hypothetical protein [Candidatus Moranbacteria bacterium]
MDGIFLIRFRPFPIMPIHDGGYSTLRKLPIRSFMKQCYASSE